MSNGYDSIVEALSEHRAGSKLKRISLHHSKHSSLSEISFIFEGNKDEEKVVLVWGKDLGVGFGTQESKSG